MHRSILEEGRLPRLIVPRSVIPCSENGLNTHVAGSSRSAKFLRMRVARVTLLWAAGLNFGLSLLHLLLFVLPQSALEFLEAPAWVRSADMPKLLLTSSIFGALFAVFGWYALSAASIGPRLPLLRTGVILIGAMYLLRGLLVIQELRLSAARPEVIVPPQEFLFSAVAFVIGLLYAVGLRGQWGHPRA